MKTLLLLAALSALPAGAQSKKIVVSGMSAEEIAELKRAAPSANIVASKAADLAKDIADADAVMGPMRPADFKAAKKLQWWQITHTGVEHDLFPEVVSSNVTVTNTKNVYGPQIADHAMAFLLTLTRKLNVTLLQQSKEEWPRGRDGMFELNGKTAVIIGCGSIGGNIAQRAHGFGMKIICVDPRDIPPSNVINRVMPPDRLDEAVAMADVLFMSAPHTKKTEGMLGMKQFDSMKKGSYFIAVSRGKTYSMEGLVKALDSRRLAGAGVDVTDPEPLPKGHALWKFPNVLITPHTAGGSDNLVSRMNSLFSENLRRFVNGQPLLGVVDKNAGY